jgi:hypothetical protein
MFVVYSLIGPLLFTGFALDGGCVGVDGVGVDGVGVDVGLEVLFILLFNLLYTNFYILF